MAQNVNAERRSTDYTGRSVQEAVERAAADIGVPASDIDYTVLRDNTHTILGLVRTGEATIRVWLGQRGSVSEAAVQAARTTAPDGTTDGDVRDDWGDTGEEPSADEAEDKTFEDEDLGASALEDETLDEEPEGEATEDEDYGDAVHGYAPSGPSTARGEWQDLARVTSDVVTRLIDAMGLYAAVEVTERGGQLDPDTNEVAPLQVNIIGDDLGLLIGRRGETLRDLQFLTRLIISRKIGRWPNVVVDVEGYKSRRAETLEALARRMADRVRTTHQPVTLEPMPAYERRIVHLTLRNDKDVYTESTGEGESRKVQILPRDQ